MVATLLMTLVPPFKFQLPLIVQLAFDASKILAARPLLFEVVSVPPVKLKTEKLVAATLVAISD